MSIRIFNYIPELDCFIVNPDYKDIANQLGLIEWNEVVWIGRFFALDNDYGEHWFDNWAERDAIEEKAKKMGIKYDDILVIDPDRFKNDKDGPCHTPQERKRFWTDVLTSLELSLDTLFSEARKHNQKNKDMGESHISDLENVIKKITTLYKNPGLL